jgi:hypothetical protein
MPRNLLFGFYAQKTGKSPRLWSEYVYLTMKGLGAHRPTPCVGPKHVS